MTRKDTACAINIIPHKCHQITLFVPIHGANTCAKITNWLFSMAIKSAVCCYSTMTSSSGIVTLSKEQAAILLPLLPSLAGTLAQPEAQPEAQKSLSSAPSTDVDNVEGIQQYTNAEMFTRKRKNARSTSAQNHLLVSTL